MTLSVPPGPPYSDREQALQRSIAELQEQVAALQLHVQQLATLDNVYNDVTTTLSHELRTPLTLISGYAQQLLLRWDSLDEQRRHATVEKINISAHRMGRLLDDLLLLGQVESGALDIRLSAVALSEVVAMAVSEVADRYGDAAPPLICDGRDLVVWADRFRCEQVLISLLDNAVKHTVAGEGVTVRWQEEEREVVLAVVDRGGGIAADDLPRLFTRFGRLQRTMGQSVGGVGLGLYVARHLVEAMGGRIWVESTLGVGSTFRVALPLREPH